MWISLNNVCACFCRQHSAEILDDNSSATLDSHVRKVCESGQNRVLTCAESVEGEWHNLDRIFERIPDRPRSGVRVNPPSFETNPINTTCHHVPDSRHVLTGFPLHCVLLLTTVNTTPRRTIVIRFWMPTSRSIYIGCGESRKAHVAGFRRNSWDKRVHRSTVCIISLFHRFAFACRIHICHFVPLRLLCVRCCGTPDHEEGHCGYLKSAE